MAPLEAAFGEVLSWLERGLDGTDCPRIAGCPAIAGVNKTLVLVVGRIVVADVSRPVFHEAQSQAGVPIGVIRSDVVIRLGSNTPLMLGVK